MKKRQLPKEKFVDKKKMKLKEERFHLLYQSIPCPFKPRLLQQTSHKCSYENLDMTYNISCKSNKCTLHI
jgi:hypothetical protein